MKCLFIDLGKSFGGAERYFVDLINSWQDRGNQSYVVVRKKSFLYDLLIKNNNFSLLIGVDISFRDISSIKKLIQIENIKLAQINGINSSFFLYCVSIKKVVTVHSDSYWDRIEKLCFIRALFVILEIFLLNKANLVICVSMYLKDLMKSRGVKSEIVVIDNGVKKIYYPLKKYRSESDSILKICFVGRLEKVKDIDLLVDAFRLIPDEKFKCDIYGTGSLECDITSKINKYNLDDKVQLKGFCPNVRQQLNQYDLYVLPSVTESSPLGVLEAMNAKVLVLCSNVGGVPYIVKDNINGYLFKKGDCESLKEKILDVLQYPMKQIPLVENAYNDFLSLYDLEIMLNKTIECLESVGRNE